MKDKQQEKAFKEIQEFYRGFFIEEPVGNNAFSFDLRTNKKIFVPPLVEGDWRDARVGSESVFSEVYEGEGKNICGLEHFIYWQSLGKHFFIFDNHNHAFAFWTFGISAGILSPGHVLVHVDQHKDMRAPQKFLEKEFWRCRTLHEVCDYANHELNVGNFIPPAIEAGIFSDVICVDAESRLEVAPPNRCVADIDLDFFSPQMEYIPFEKRMDFVRALVEHSAFVTIATSPYFVEQHHALAVLRNILDHSHNL